MATRDRDSTEEVELTNQELLERSRRRLLSLREHDPELRELAPSPELLEQIQKCPTTIETVAKAFELYADRPCFAERAFEITGETLRFLPELRKLRYRDVWARVEAFASGLAHEKLVRPGDFIGICGFGSIDWVVADYAALHRSAPSAPFQTNMKRDDLQQVIRECSIVCLVCSPDQLDAIDAVLPQCPSVESLVVMDVRDGDRATADKVARRKTAATAGGPRVLTMKEVEAVGLEKGIVPKVLPSERGEADPLMTLIYTSGSTGAPKGAMFPESLYQRMWQTGHTTRMVGTLPELPVIAVDYMPLNHGAGRFGLMTSVMRGGLTSFLAKSDMSTLLEDIRLLQPTYLLLVPRVASTFYQHYQDEGHSSLGGGVGREAKGRDLPNQGHGRDAALVPRQSLFSSRPSPLSRPDAARGRVVSPAMLRGARRRHLRVDRSRLAHHRPPRQCRHGYRVEARRCPRTRLPDDRSAVSAWRAARGSRAPLLGAGGTTRTRRRRRRSSTTRAS